MGIQLPNIVIPCRGVGYIVSCRNLQIIMLSLLFLLGLAEVKSVSAKAILVFAAASTMNALEAATLKFNQMNDVRVRGVYASSAVLAKQIQNGAPADIYLSANAMWMDYLSNQRRIVLNSRNDLLSNRLVVIVPSNAPVTSGFRFGSGILKLINNARFASGDPAHVPLGIYARQALKSVNAWNAAKKFLVGTMDSKMALRLVAREEVSLGIVYASDAKSTARVRIVDTIPLSNHEPIRYPIALIAKNENPIARKFLKFLFTPEIQKLFRRHGFSLP